MHPQHSPLTHPLPAGDPPPDMLPVDPDTGPAQPADPQDTPPVPVIDPGR